MRISVVFILILFVAFDLGLGIECKDEIVPSLIAGEQTHIEKDHSGQEDSTDLAHECFCCCQHIQVQDFVEACIDMKVIDKFTLAHDMDLTLYPTPLYHPPRLTLST